MESSLHDTGSSPDLGTEDANGETLLVASAASSGSDDEHDVLADLSGAYLPPLHAASEPPDGEDAGEAAASAGARRRPEGAPGPAAGASLVAATPEKPGAEAPSSTPTQARGGSLGPAAAAARRELRESEWAVFAASSYESQAEAQFEGKWEFLSSAKKSQAGAAGTAGTAGAAAASRLLAKRLETYQRQGLRRSVAPVLLCHLREYLHVLLLFHREARRYTLLTFKAKSWERPEDVLERKLEKILTKHRSEVHKSLANYTWVAPEQNEKVTADVREFLGEWWRPELDEEPLPFLPPHVTRPKERIRLYQVQLPQKCSFRLPPALSLAAIPLFDLLRPEIHGLALAGIPHMLSRFRFRLLELSVTWMDSSTPSIGTGRRSKGTGGRRDQEEDEEEDFSPAFLEELTSQDAAMETVNEQGPTEELPPELAALAAEEEEDA
ncbi:putative mrna cleavage factor family protein [Besnoitia besnoiti]|uniref:Putative mrna cleavage factor family protein n=1 Tax=Besnoitia besnoiti TaxID=94643 RepID=A0A2A9MD41_BESBE|nr:putative mrna cleavage factor family protein [Besnoitia besnoiti]PFH33866.1 putative mrna cleavage factor family protein [Besnoitia besnoiti]